MTYSVYCRQSIEGLVHAIKVSAVRRWEMLEDLEIQFVGEIGEAGHLACREGCLGVGYEGDVKGRTLRRRCQQPGSLCSTPAYFGHTNRRLSRR